jgi:hypothetical protein
MLPRGYAILPHLPRTPSSDKLDRNTLQNEVVVSWVAQDDSSTFVQANTQVEQALAEIVAGFLTENRQEIGRARHELHQDGAWSGGEPVGLGAIQPVGWQEINVSLAPSDMGIDSTFAPLYALEVAERLGVVIENRELFCPIADTTRAIAFLLAEMAERAEQPISEGGEQHAAIS